MIKRIAFIIAILVLIPIFLRSCYNDDDFAPYTYYIKELSIKVESPHHSISDLEKELTNIASRFDNNTSLTRAIIIFDGIDQIKNQKGVIEFTFFKRNENKYINQVTQIILKYNMHTNSIYEMEYEKGHGKRVGGIEYPIGKKVSKYLFKDIFLKLYENNEFRNKLTEIKPKLQCEFMNDDLDIRLFDDNKLDSVFSFEN